MSAGVPGIEDFQVRLKAFDYGVVSVALRQPVPDSWKCLLAAIPRLYDDAGLADAGDRARRTLMDCIAPALIRPRADSLSEDYRFAVEQTAMARGELLELAIVLILVFELVLFFAGVMR